MIDVVLFSLWYWWNRWWGCHMAAFWGQRFSIASWLNLLLVGTGLASDLYADDTRLWVSLEREDEHITSCVCRWSYKYPVTLMLSNFPQLIARKSWLLPSVGRSLTVILYLVFPCTMGMQLLLKKSFNVPPLNIGVNITYESQSVQQ